MGEKSWVYWVGLIIVTIAIIGFIRGVFGLIVPIPRLHLRGVTDLAPMVVRFAGKLIGSTVFLVTGVYMMIKGSH